MKIVAINGSPRKNGNTARLIEMVLKPLQSAGWETEVIQLGGRPIGGCKACYQCFEKKNGLCAFGNDDFNAIFEKLTQADAMLIGSSTYFADVTSETKALIDRAGFVAMANDCLFAGKVGVGLTAVRRGGGVRTVDTINHLFLISQMLVPGSTYWNLGFGFMPGDVESDAMGVANMEHLGKVIDWLATAARNAPSPYPVRKEGESA
jgi:multimeric flavodoxin WrbA